MKKVLSVLLVLTLMLSLAACGGTNTASEDATTAGGETTAAGDEATSEDDSNDDTSSKDTDTPLIIGTADFTGDFIEGWSNSSYDVNIRKLVFGYGLMTNDRDGNMMDSPLVTEKTVSDDLTEWTFKLVDGATFHNGEELTASDVKFTYELFMDKEALKKTGGTNSFDEFIEEVTVDEETNTVKFKLKKVIYTVDFTVFSSAILPEDTITKGAKEEGLNVQEYVKAHISEPIGYGPYVLDEYAESEYCKLSAFDGYLGKKPSIKNLIVKVVPTETELDQLLQGEIDVLAGQTESEKIEAALNNNMSSNNYFRHGGGTVVLHTDFGPTQLTEVRQAFAYVFNRPKVIELFLGEYGISSQGPYSKNHWMMYDDDEADLIGRADVGRFEASLTDYDILDEDGNFDEDANIAKAHELLDAAAAKTEGAYAKLTGDAEAGYLWEGEPLDIAITYTEFWADTYNLVWNEEYISKLGFNVTLTGLDWPVMYGHWIGDTTEERQYSAFVGGVSYLLKDNPKDGYSTDKILEWGQPSNNGPRFKGGSTYTPEEWDELLNNIENCNPVDGRDDYRNYWREYVKAFNKEVPIIPVYSNNYYDFYIPELENFKTNAIWDWPYAILDANLNK